MGFKVELYTLIVVLLKEKMHMAQGVGAQRIKNKYMDIINTIIKWKVVKWKEQS